MKIAKCFSTDRMSHTATFRREVGGVYPVRSLPHYHVTQTQGGLIGFDAGGCSTTTTGFPASASCLGATCSFASRDSSLPRPASSTPDDTSTVKGEEFYTARCSGLLQ